MLDPKIFTGIPAPDSADFGGLVAFCESCRSHVLAALPSVAGELVCGGLGFDGMLGLIREHGGTPVYWTIFSKRAGVNAALVERLRVQSKDALHIALPSASGVMDALRRVAIQQALNAGETTAEAARRFGVSDRSISKLRRGRTEGSR